MSTTASPEAVKAATSILRALMGNRWTWTQREVVEIYHIPTPVPPQYTNVPTPFTDFYGYVVFNLSTNRPTLFLAGRPVTSVISVLDSSGTAVSGYELSNSSQLTLPNSLWGPNDLTVTYRYGSRPSLAVQRAIDQLADEINKADCDDDSCALPERVTTITRQGVSWTVIDPQTFIDKGRTGLYYVDLVIQAFNGGSGWHGASGAKRRARVFSPEYRPPRRISTTIL